MLERLMIKGFESHAETEIEFSPAVTFITGNSDSGKSGIMRALRWVMLNESEGDSFIPHNAKRGHMTEAELTLDGQTITRKRSRSENLYALNGEEFRAFGLEVPEPIAKLLNLSPLVSQAQIDSHFALSNTGGENARLISDIVALDAIDKATKAAKEMKSANDKEVANADASVKDLVEKVAKGEVWYELNKLFEEQETLSATMDKKQVRIRELENALAQLRNLRLPIGLSEPDYPNMPIDESLSLGRSLREYRTVLEKPVIELSEPNFPEKPIDESNALYVDLDIYRRLLQKPVIELSEPVFPTAPVFDDMGLASAIRQTKSIQHPITLEEPKFPEMPANKAPALAQAIDELKRVTKGVTHSQNDLSVVEAQWKVALQSNPICETCGSESKHWRIK